MKNEPTTLGLYCNINIETFCCWFQITALHCSLGTVEPCDFYPCSFFADLVQLCVVFFILRAMHACVHLYEAEW